MEGFCPILKGLCPNNERCALFDFGANQCGLLTSYDLTMVAMAIRDVAKELNRANEQLEGGNKE